MPPTAQVPALSRLSRQPLPQQVADRIIEAVADGVLRPGDRVTDSDIARRLGVSRGPVREAMKILEAQGIIVSTPHRSTVVVDFGKDKVEQISVARVAIEKVAFGDAAKAYAAEPARIEELDRILDIMERCAAAGDLNGITKADLAFHRAVVAASKNEIILTLWETIARHMRISFNLEIQEDPAAPSEIPRHHRALRDVLARGDREEVEREIERHILRLQRSP